MNAAPTAGARLPVAVPAAIAAAWALTLVAQVSGRARLLDHDALVYADHRCAPRWLSSSSPGR